MTQHHVEPSTPTVVERAPKVGMVLAFTGRYRSARIIADFLQGIGVDLRTSEKTTPAVLQTASGVASSEFCVPLRVFVGHFHRLLEENPDLDYVVTPNLYREDHLTSTCSKYRDIGGVAVRSLGDMVGYRLGSASPWTSWLLSRAWGPEKVRSARAGAEKLPRVLQPQVWSAERHHLLNVCFDLFRILYGYPRWTKFGLLVPRTVRPHLAPWVARVEEAFEAAYEAHDPESATRHYYGLFKDPERPRLALIGRRYLLHDDTLSADLRRYFLAQGVNVVTADDVPFSELRPFYEEVDGYFDTHREGQALIDWAAPLVDGFISVGSFGCHPDAFQVDTLADYARQSDKPVWTFRYDETVGQGGFVTRYETIMSFLERERDGRLARGGKRNGETAQATPTKLRLSGMPGGTSQFRPTAHARTGPANGAKDRARIPLIVWPSMGELLDLLIAELAYQVGWTDYIHVPPPVSEETIRLGNTHFTDSCSPFALSTGSMVQSIQEALEDIRLNGDDHPRRIVVIMVRGEGPCTVGWYALVQHKILPQLFREEIEKHGHTIELATIGLDGVGDFLRDMADLGDKGRLQGILRYVSAWEDGIDKLSWARKVALRMNLTRNIAALSKTLWPKLKAGESLRAEALRRRAHELERGSITRAYREGVELLNRAHSKASIHRALQRARDRLRAVPQDNIPRPRAVVVGEIYVALTSFANRGAVENLLAREGVELVEGISISQFIRHTLHEWKRRGRANHPLVRPLLDWLTHANVYLLTQGVRDPAARPFMENEVGGEGMVSVGAARRAVEQGAQGILHVFPFKCMPEGLAKDAIKELSRIYGVRYLSTSFDRETDVERLKTELVTYAALLKSDLSAAGVQSERDRVRLTRQLSLRRRWLGFAINRVYLSARGLLGE